MNSNVERQILEGLNANQRDAVQAIDGPLLIIAGPGSGKTRVITHRIAYLVRVVGITPYRIAAVTFTNKAAREMRQRLVPLLGSAAEHLTASTFHAFCAGVLRREHEHIGISRDFAIYDDSDQMALVKRCLTELELDPKRYPPRSILSAISSAKSQLLGTEGFAMRSASYWDEIVARTYERYEDLLHQSSAVDFDDLLLKTFQLFEAQPEVAGKYQDRYVHFMIDEFQDTNVAQYAIAKQLASRHLNICVVGDPDQSIYTWRNADIRNILSFQDDYPNSKLIALEENYRSTQTILDAARNLIASNTQRVEKDLWTRNGSGVPIVIAEGYNEDEEAQFVAKEIQSLMRAPSSGNSRQQSGTGGASSRNEQNGKRYGLGDIAVMYRVNAQSRALEEACLRYGIPYQVVGGLKFYQRQEVKDITAYLRLIANPDDDVSLSRVVNLPARGIGQRTLDHLRRSARDAGISQFAAIDAIASGSLTPSGSVIANPFTARALTALTGFRNLIKAIADERYNMDLPDLIDLVVERSGYGRWLMEQPDRGDERLENIQEFRSSARDFLPLGREEALTAFLESVSLVADVDSFEQKSDAITLITLHQAKGLEFPVVFMVGMEDGLLPHNRSLDDSEQIEEERRLCYVGVTRAQERLYLLRAFRRGFRGGSEPGIPSRFLMDIPPELLAAPSQSRKARTAQPTTQTQRRTAASQQGRRMDAAEPPPSRRRTQDGTQNRSQNDRLRRTLSQMDTPAAANRRSLADQRRRASSGDANRGGALRSSSGSLRSQTSAGAGVRRQPRVRRGSSAPKIPHLATGDKVQHGIFGEGIVMECKPSGSDYEVTVAFKDGAGVKRLLLGMAPLEKMG